MYKNKSLQIFCISLLFVSGYLECYSIHFVNKNSDPSCYNTADINQNVVDIYVAKNKDALKKIWEKQGFKEDFYKGLALSNEYMHAIRPYLEKGAKFIPEPYGTALSGAVAPVDEVHKFLVVDFPGYFDKLFGGLLEGGFRKSAGVIAYHRNVPRGNSGFRASYGRDEIKKNDGVAPGSTVYVTVVGKANKQVLLYDEPLKTDQYLSFIVKFDPNTRACIGIPVNYFDDPDQMIPTGPALQDTQFMNEWTSDMNKKMPSLRKESTAGAGRIEKAIQEIKAGKDPIKMLQDEEAAKSRKTMSKSVPVQP